MSKKHTFTVTLDGEDVGEIIFRPKKVQIRCDNPMMVKPLEGLAQALTDEMAKFAGVERPNLKEKRQTSTPVQNDKGKGLIQ